MEKYLTLLQNFGVQNQVDELLQTSSYVSMDNIHDAIILTGVSMEEPLQHYIIKAKQEAIDEYRANVRQKRLRDEKGHLIEPNEVDEHDWNQYGFTPLEKELAIELAEGIPLKQSKFTKAKRHRIRMDITKKMLPWACLK